MKQTCYEFYCNFFKWNIGLGYCCFDCKAFKGSNSSDKKCDYELVLRIFEREV